MRPISTQEPLNPQTRVRGRSESQMETASRIRRVFFPNLNGLRFIAAFLVIVHHVEQFKVIYGYENHWGNGFIRIIGNLGVILFFVLSGFLITFLLLQEKAEMGTIGVKNFYKRRILRIWPLYYWVVCLALFVFPAISFLSVPEWSAGLTRHFQIRAALFLLFAPNVASAFMSPVPYASQAWSVGVEEQFYFLWPWLVKRMRSTVGMLSGVILLTVAVKVILILCCGLSKSKAAASLLAFWQTFNIDCMAIGGLGAWLLQRKRERVLAHLFSRFTQIAVYGATVALLCVGYQMPWLNQEFYAVLFAVLIVNCAGNPRSVLRLENSALVYCGKVSYGIYMYHPLVIVIVLKTLAGCLGTNSLVLYLTCTVLTICVAAISYELFESRFIRMKLKYSTIVTGDNASKI
jgi:peptidoglycan/LPS O-acetylase OafA/YrhL